MEAPLPAGRTREMEGKNVKLFRYKLCFILLIINILTICRSHAGIPAPFLHEPRELVYAANVSQNFVEPIDFSWTVFMVYASERNIASVGIFIDGKSCFAVVRSYSGEVEFPASEVIELEGVSQARIDIECEDLVVIEKLAHSAARYLKFETKRTRLDRPFFLGGAEIVVGIKGFKGRHLHCFEIADFRDDSAQGMLFRSISVILAKAEVAAFYEKEENSKFEEEKNIQKIE